MQGVLLSDDDDHGVHSNNGDATSCFGYAIDIRPRVDHCFVPRGPRASASSRRKSDEAEDLLEDLQKTTEK